eukprot:m.144648 g.144648  ORF g.144648 m.144648 type:complete len:469 (+) comp14928_c0_seq7:165-1571(+)
MLLFVLGFFVVVAVLGFLLRPSYDDVGSNAVNNKGYLYNDTLASLLQKERVSLKEMAMERGYGPVLKIVKVLIGVIPSCDEYLEIWPAGFRTYNLMVPNLFNIPIFTLGLGVRQEASLAMYVASRVAKCGYCSAHTCSYAVRRGAKRDHVENAIFDDDDESNERSSKLPDKIQATMRVARGISTIPCSITDNDRLALRTLYSSSDAEWIACGAIGMGFLNKVMDALSVELEVGTYAQTKKLLEHTTSVALNKADHDIKQVDTLDTDTTPVKDDLYTKLDHLRYIPGAVLLERAWTVAHNIPSTWPAIGEYLKTLTGCDFPVFQQIQNRRVAFALASMIRENMDKSSTTIGLAIKAPLSVIFARGVQSDTLEEYAKNFTLEGKAVTDSDLKTIDQVCASPNTYKDKIPIIYYLMEAISHTPARVSLSLVTALEEGGVTPQSIVEVVTLAAVLQCLHRLCCYYPTTTTQQ